MKSGNPLTRGVLLACAVGGVLGVFTLQLIKMQIVEA